MRFLSLFLLFKGGGRERERERERDFNLNGNCEKFRVSGLGNYGERWTARI
jgi:hypothetical protein